MQMTQQINCNHRPRAVPAGKLLVMPRSHFMLHCTFCNETGGRNGAAIEDRLARATSC